jgi:PHD/YefM family antitoxin component YafN of YafNO toxin-antitoxin module
MKVSLKDFKKDVEKYMKSAKNEPIIIKKMAFPHTVIISYEIYKALLEGAWAENALKYSDEETKQKAKKIAEKNDKKK